MFSTCHLFAGCGGGLLADLILGHFPKYAVERDSYCCAILRDRFPKTTVIESDVRDVDFSRMADVDAICAGFPCQDISIAGEGAGIHGARSGLYREVVRAVESIKPGVVFLENSPEIRTRGRHIVIGDFVALGYSWRDGIFAASDCGAPHRRRRWFCVCVPTPTVFGNYNRKGSSKTSGDGLATYVRRFPTPTARDWKSGTGAKERPGHTLPLSSEIGGMLNPEWVEWLMGWPIGHTELEHSGMVKFPFKPPSRSES